MKKTRVQDLAIFGGEPAFPHALHVGRPNIGDRRRFLERVDEVLDRNWLTNEGPCVRDFEARIAEILGVRNCVAVCNGTIALQLAIRALDLVGEVIVPSFTFVATAHALEWQGVRPVFCDIESEHLTLDPARIEQHVTPHTSAILAVHTWGRSARIEALAEIAERHGLRLIFDSCHAFGCSHGGRMIGNFGDAEVFSFHATKFVNSLEGGAVVTNNDDLAERVRRMKNFGFTGTDEVRGIGINGKMNEIAAAMGLSSLEQMDGFIESNRLNLERYQTGLRDCPGIAVLPFDEGERGNYQYVTLIVDDDALSISRDEILSVLLAEKVRARRYFYPGIHNMEPYRSAYPDARLVLPNTEHYMRRVICLPTGTAVGADDIAAICNLLRLASEHGSEIQRMLAAGGAPRARRRSQS